MNIMMMIAMMMRMMMLMMIRSATHVLTIAQRHSSAWWHCAAEFFRSVVVRQERHPNLFTTITIIGVVGSSVLQLLSEVRLTENSCQMQW